MYLGKVIGTVVSTVKAPSLTGSKFLIVEKINQDLTAKKQTEIAVDTVGAGDGFAVGILSAWLEGKEMPDMVDRGNAIGSIQVSVSSDNEGLPTREELDAYMKGAK